MTPEARLTLVDDYEAFLRVGRVTTGEWATLDEDEKACLLVAQKRIDVECAVMSASQDPLAVALLMREIDGGEMLARLQTAAVVDAALARQGAVA